MDNTNIPDHQKKDVFPFFELPFELRIQVYNELPLQKVLRPVFSHKEGIYYYDYVVQTSCLQSCHQINEEIKHEKKFKNDKILQERLHTARNKEGVARWPLVLVCEMPDTRNWEPDKWGPITTFYGIMQTLVEARLLHRADVRNNKTTPDVVDIPTEVLIESFMEYWEERYIRGYTAELSPASRENFRLFVKAVLPRIMDKKDMVRRVRISLKVLVNRTLEEIRVPTMERPAGISGPHGYWWDPLPFGKNQSSGVGFYMDDELGYIQRVPWDIMFVRGIDRDHHSAFEELRKTCIGRANYSQRTIRFLDVPGPTVEEIKLFNRSAHSDVGSGARKRKLSLFIGE